MPGPLLTITISESTNRGPVAGPLLITGHAVLELLLLIGLLFGLGPLLKNNTFFIAIICVARTRPKGLHKFHYFKGSH